MQLVLLLQEADERMMAIARQGMSGEEASFAVEANIGDQNLKWMEKYRPQKPKYFNRVHTGFDWNKYNQTHYDMDNPPPKIVQGYRFNVCNFLQDETLFIAPIADFLSRSYGRNKNTNIYAPRVSRRFRFCNSSLSRRAAVRRYRI